MNDLQQDLKQVFKRIRGKAMDILWVVLKLFHKRGKCPTSSPLLPLSLSLSLHPEKQEKMTNAAEYSFAIWPFLKQFIPVLTIQSKLAIFYFNGNLSSNL